MWAAIGYPERAEALARAITDPAGQSQALIDLAQAAADEGDFDRSRALADEAEAVARAITDPDGKARVLAEAGAGGG